MPGAAILRGPRRDYLPRTSSARALYAPLFDSPNNHPTSPLHVPRPEGKKEFFCDWEHSAGETVANLRIDVGRDRYEPALIELVGELSTRTAEFRTLWAAHNVRLHQSGAKHARTRLPSNANAPKGRSRQSSVSPTADRKARAGGARHDLCSLSMSSAQLYDTIGATYTVTRCTEPRIAAQVWAALGDARTVLNVGAGTASYEPSDLDVTAVEPSAVMRAQRPAGAARCVAGTAESLPFKDQSFDAAMAVATVHHWRDPIAGLLEMRRVARRVVVLTCETTDRSWRRRFWLTRDYLPEVAASRVGLATKLARAIGARMEPVLIPWDCADGFFEAYWRRPEAYLDESVRRGVSVWATVGPDAEERAVRCLRDDLASGRWAERNRDLLDLEAAELGLRLLIA